MEEREKDSLRARALSKPHCDDEIGGYYAQGGEREGVGRREEEEGPPLSYIYTQKSHLSRGNTVKKVYRT